MAFPPPPQRRPDATPATTAPPVTLPPAPPVTATAVPTPATVAAPAAFTFGKPPVDEAAAQAKLAAEITAKTEAQAAELAKQQAAVPITPPAPVFAPKPAPVASAPAPVAVKQKRAKAVFGSATMPVPAVGGLDPAAVIVAFVDFFKQPGCPALADVAEAYKKVNQAAFPDTTAGRKAFRAGAIILAIAQWASDKKAPGQRGGDAKGPLAKYRSAMLDLLAMAGLDAVAKKWGVEKLQSIKLTAAELAANNIACTAEQAVAYGITA